MHTQNGNLSEVITTFTTGLGSLNGLIANTQYLSTGTSGSDFNISSVTDTHTFNLPTASSTKRGALSSADWSTFNGKMNYSDTASLSNRINLKLNYSDTVSLSNRINTKLNSSDTASLSNRINAKADALNGTTNTVPKFTSSTTIGNSNIKDNGSAVSVNTTAGSFGALQVGTYNGNILMNTTNTNGGLIFQNTSSSNKLWDFSSDNNDLAFNESNVAPVIKLKAGGNVQVYNLSGTGTRMVVADLNGVLSTQAISSDTTSLSNRINLKLNISDTASMLSGYQSAINSKQAQLSGTGFVKASGTSITYDNSTYYLASNPNGYGTGTITSVTGTSPIVSSGGTTPAISIPAATSSVNGYLSSTDWTTFNNKSNTSGTVTSVATGLGLSGGTITTSGTLLVDTASASILSRQRAANTYATTSSLSGYLPLTGGTLTGALGINNTNGAGNFINLNDGNVAFGAALGLGSSGDFVLSSIASSSLSERLRIARSSGAATFSTTATTAISMVSSATASSLQLRNTGGTTSDWVIQSDGSTASASFNIYSITAGAYRLSILGSGNIGIGTSSSAAILRPLSIKPASDIPQLYLVQNNNDAGGWMMRAGLDGHYHLISYQGSESEKFTIRYDNGATGIGVIPSAWGSGYLGFQNGVAGTHMTYSNNHFIGVNFYFDAANYRAIQTGAASRVEFGDDNIYFKNAASVAAGATQTWNERMRITSGGNVGINYAGDASTRLAVFGVGTTSGTFGFLVANSAGTTSMWVKDNGDGYLRASAWAYGSDIRMKENISDVENGLDMVLKMKPKHFDYINGQKNNLGFIAQDIQEIIPQAVSISDEKTGMLALKTDFLVPYLTKSVQELSQKLDELSAKNEALIKRIETLENK
jgi:hypothetical protein